MQVMIKGEERRLQASIAQERTVAQRTLTQIDAARRAEQLCESVCISAQVNQCG